MVVISELQDGMRPRPPNFYFPDTSFPGIRRRLLRLANDLSQYVTPDTLYEEILDCFTSFGVERRVSTAREIPEFPWASFIPDADAEVKLGQQFYDVIVLRLFETY
jgi:hypothetical protein